jgi:acyl carrier protein
MARLDELLAEIFPDETDGVGEDALFVTMSGWDSLRHVEFIIAIETRFGLDLTPAEIAALTSKRTARAILAGRGVNA